MQPRTPIVLITGALGSGKTTLMRNILAAAGKRFAVVMNEFGQIAIDGRLIAGKAVTLIELAGGCVCCSLTGEFEAAVREIIDRARPDCILVEATGVAEADALSYEVAENLPEVRLDSVITIVDAYAAVRYPRLGYAARNQLEAADIVLLNKTDLVSAGELEHTSNEVRRINPRAVCIHTRHCALDFDLLFGLGVTERFKPKKHHAPEQHLDAVVFTSSRCLDEERFLQLLGDLPRAVIRAKGFVRWPAGTRLVNYVTGRIDIEELPADSTQLVFIGSNMADHREWLMARLRYCEV
jgi:G3E family GTPase